MTDPTKTPGSTRPPRAEPLQPDRPSSGDDQEGAPAREGDAGGARQRKQSDDALDNVREGYK